MDTKIVYGADGKPEVVVVPPLFERLKPFVVGASLVLSVLCVYALVSVMGSFAERMAVREQAAVPADTPKPKLDKLLIEWVKQNSKYKVPDTYAQSIVDKVYANSDKVDPYLMLAVIQVESQFDYKAQSAAGAKGLTQVIPKWHQDKIQKRDIFDPAVNIHVGATALNEYIKLHGSVDKGLLRYNGSLGIPKAGYAAKVLAVKQNLETYLLSNL